MYSAVGRAALSAPSSSFLASVEQQVEHEGAVQLAFGHERERASAGAEDLAEHPFPQTAKSSFAKCGRCGSEPLRDLVVVLSLSDRDI
jgi:hypothetical protein